jgi:hypothetical protein
MSKVMREGGGEWLVPSMAKGGCSTGETVTAMPQKKGGLSEYTLLGLEELPAQAEGLNGVLITLFSGGFEVIQKFPATRHHFEQTTPSGVVFGVGVEVLGEVIDALRQQGDLDVCTTGVLFVELKSAKGGGLGFAHGIDGSPPW